MAGGCGGGGGRRALLLPPAPTAASTRPPFVGAERGQSRAPHRRRRAMLLLHPPLLCSPASATVPPRHRGGAAVPDQQQLAWRRRKGTERGRKFGYRVASDAKCLPCLGTPLEGFFYRKSTVHYAFWGCVAVCQYRWQSKWKPEVLCVSGSPVGGRGGSLHACLQKRWTDRTCKLRRLDHSIRHHDTSIYLPSSLEASWKAT